MMISSRISFSLLLIGLLLASLPLTAQRARFKPQTHELALQLGSAQIIPTEATGTRLLPAGGSEEVLQIGTQLINGGRYTYHHSLSDGFRLGVVNRRATFYSSLNEIQKTDWDIRLGYMRKKHSGPNQIFFGIDAMLTQQEQAYQSAAGVAVANVNAQSAGVAPFVGYRYFFAQFISLGLEAEVYGLRVFSRTGGSEAFPADFLQQGEIGFQTSALLSFHFGKMKKRCTCPKVRR
jgi:hypothetical protein